MRMEFSQAVLRKKVVDTLPNFGLKYSLCSVSTKIVFQPSQGLIQIILRAWDGVSTSE